MSTRRAWAAGPLSSGSFNLTWPTTPGSRPQGSGTSPRSSGSPEPSAPIYENIHQSAAERWDPSTGRGDDQGATARAYSSGISSQGMGDAPVEPYVGRAVYSTDRQETFTHTAGGGPYQEFQDRSNAGMSSNMSIQHYHQTPIPGQQQQYRPSGGQQPRYHQQPGYQHQMYPRVGGDGYPMMQEGSYAPQDPPPPYTPPRAGAEGVGGGAVNVSQEWIQQQIRSSLDQMGIGNNTVPTNVPGGGNGAPSGGPVQQEVMEPEEPVESEEETRRRTKQSYIRKSCTLVEHGVLNIHLGNALVTFEDKQKRIKKVEIGRKKMGAQEKIIMVVGATGSGKTTLINGMFNYVVGVDWEDDSRLKLVQEIATGQVANQAKSQTNWITSYTIHHKTGFTVPYTLTIIDTPGFGDTDGIQRDKAITEQIRTFFTTRGANGVDMLDAVGFVAQSSLPRLTPTQRYIFDSILSLFGKDIADNIFMLLTFADGQKPQVLSGIKEAKMPYKKFFKFNNSALYVRNQENQADDEDDDENFDEMFWKMGVKSFRVFMTELGKVQPRSLLLTKDVLNERNRLEITIEGIQRDIKVGLNKLEQLQKEVQVLKNHQADIDKNKNFMYSVNEQSVETKPTNPGQYTTNCIKCNKTCHEECQIPNDEDKAGCWAMTDENCRICSEGCHWTMHRNQPYVYVIKTQKVKKTADDLKKRYEEAEGRKLTAQQLIKKCADEFEAVQMKILSLTEEARKSIAKLDSIALRPNPLSTVDYIEILIASEQAECRPGWKRRVQQLTEVKGKAEQMQKLADRGFDPFIEYKRKYDEEQRQNKDGPWTNVMKYLNREFGGSG